jgi:hypothetical protein
LAGVYDRLAGQLRLYRNGTLVTTVPCSYSWSAGGKLTIGKALGGDYWLGEVDDVRVWNRVLSHWQIRTLSWTRG